MKQINTVEDLIRWATIVNQGLTIQKKCDMQDVYAHSGYNELLEMFMQCNNRKLVLCSVYNTMGYDEVERLLKHFAKQKGMEVADKEINERLNNISKREVELFQKEQTFKECHKSYWKRMKQLKDRNQLLENHNIKLMQKEEKARKQIQELNLELKTFKEKAEKYDTLKQLLSI